MPVPVHAAEDFAAVLVALLPHGRVWPRDAGGMPANTAAGIAPTFARHYARAAELLFDAFPSNTLALLPEWEATLGLPDPCSGPSPTIIQRRNAVAARIIAEGGQSVAFFVQYADALGYPIAITQYQPARFGQASFGEPMAGVEWGFVWDVNAPLLTSVAARHGVSAYGEPYQTWGNDVLECQLTALKPAHTLLLFRYGDIGDINFGDGLLDAMNLDQNSIG